MINYDLELIREYLYEEPGIAITVSDLKNVLNGEEINTYGYGDTEYTIRPYRYSRKGRRNPNRIGIRCESRDAYLSFQIQGNQLIVILKNESDEVSIHSVEEIMECV